MKFVKGDRVRLLKSAGRGKTFVAAGRCGTVKGGTSDDQSVWVDFDGPDVRHGYIHALGATELEFESILDNFTRGLA